MSGDAMARAVACDNCDWTGTEGQAGDASHLFERLDVGGEVPAGECPDCGALAYLVKGEPDRMDVLPPVLAGAHWYAVEVEVRTGHGAWDVITFPAQGYESGEASQRAGLVLTFAGYQWRHMTPRRMTPQPEARS